MFVENALPTCLVLWCLSKRSLLKDILNHTGLEQCWAPMILKELHPGLSTGSFLKNMFKHTGSEQCWAQIFVKLALLGRELQHGLSKALGANVKHTLPSGKLHPDLSTGSLLKHILNHTGSEQCFAPMSL